MEAVTTLKPDLVVIKLSPPRDEGANIINPALKFHGEIKIQLHLDEIPHLSVQALHNQKNILS
jgi:hypothetical protein